jgi:hypothetical protein
MNSLDAPCATPTLTPPFKSGPKDTCITVILETATQGAYLRYADDGSEPTPDSGMLIKAQKGPAPTVFGRTLKAIAFKSGLNPSPVAVGNYSASTPP